MDFKQVRQNLVDRYVDKINPEILSDLLDEIELTFVKRKPLSDTDKFFKKNKISLRYGQMHQDGIVTYFYSKRTMELPKVVVEYLHPLTYKLADFRFQVAAIEKDKKLFLAVAILSPKDHFNRKIGRSIVLGRLKKLIEAGLDKNGSAVYNKPFTFVL